MIHRIESDVLRVSVNSTGAELQSIASKSTGTEYLWQGDPAYWGSRAPVLFPIVGGLQKGSFTYGGKTYALAKHGFVRSAYFQRVDRETENALTFEYVDNPSTRAVYPFAFSFKVVFTLQANALRVEYRVRNESPVEMLFSAGAHEAYRCPREADEAFDDYYITFEHEGAYDSYAVSPNGLLSNDTFPVIEKGDTLPLKHTLFANDALIFKHIKSKRLRIGSNKSNGVVEVAYDSPHLGIWTKVGAPFICIEPWCGLPDMEGTDGMLAHKEGIIRLDEGGAYVFTHTITIKE